MAFVSIKKTALKKGKAGFMIIAGKSISKKAVLRNLIKRRIRVIASPLVKNSGRNYVIIVRPEAAKASFTELKEEFQKIFRKV